MYIFFLFFWNDHSSVNTPSVSWWFFGGNNLVNFLVRKLNWPWYTTRVFWWFFRGNNPWHLDIEMIMVALSLHGLEAGTKPERSGSGAGTKRIRWFQRFFKVFHGFLACRFAPTSLPLHSYFFFLVFFNVFCSFSSFFLLIFEYFFYFLNVFMFFSWDCLVFFWKG